jgi:LVIVD repeat
MPRLFLAGLALLAAGLLTPAVALAQEEPGSGSPNLSFVKNIPYEAKFPDLEAENYGTDIEFAYLRGKRHAIAGSEFNGMHIVDISRPSKAKTVGVYECGILQGDVQVFRAADRSRRTLASYTADSSADPETADSQCFKEANALGFQATEEDGSGKQGTFIVDITNPAAPRTVSFVEVPQGSHNQTVHPSGGWLYNSNSDLITSMEPAIEVIDIRNPGQPKHAGELALTALPGLGTESHDITFNKAGTRAYSAALSHGVVIDTSNPATPTIVSEFDDEAINVWHQSDPVTLKASDGTKKEFLIAEDEFAGAAGGPVCPSGGVHVYDITGEKESAPEKVGYWNIDDFGPTHDPEGTCTAHVFDIHERQQLMTIAFYNGGVRVVDLAGLADGEGMKAIASYKTDNADTWSFKAPSVSRKGVFYAYGNDIKRGLDVYRYDGREEQADNPGTWLAAPAIGGTVSSGAALKAGALKLGGVSAPKAAGLGLGGYKLSCLVGSGT